MQSFYIVKHAILRLMFMILSCQSRESEIVFLFLFSVLYKTDGSHQTATMYVCAGCTVHIPGSILIIISQM